MPSMNTISTGEVLGLGTVVIDHLVVLPSHPKADSKSTVIEDRLQVGGPVPTALVLLQRWGRSCRFIGRWSDDAFGQRIDDDLKSEGIDATGSDLFEGGRSGFAHVWVDRQTGDRAVACSRPEWPIDTGMIASIDLQNTKAVYLDGWPAEAAQSLARRAKEAGCLVCLDTGNVKPGIGELLPLVDVLNCPRSFVFDHLGVQTVEAGVEALLKMGPRTVTVTSGADGATIGTRDRIIRRDAFSVSAVDTCGAGDVFSGAMVYGVLEGWEPQRVLMFAMAAAALKCERVGNRAALPKLDEVDEFLTRVREPDLV
jgi:sugar/nucleoside kinase (ribokinase family)